MRLDNSPDGAISVLDSFLMCHFLELSVGFLRILIRKFENNLFPVIYLVSNMINLYIFQRDFILIFI
ncbi:hypothetical protein C475_18988 [Halosimplex carlsbadense 2-9-1]|uniref:Uncharacterized protein n=1 Tax=Halosimplex carlsbadense 2-9-1 TaxID=797114 RepID=M0CGS7_9EURY|nr:hypothetical protein C475_18988 [Halosimplex carlsbadense 2-9-1]